MWNYLIGGGLIYLASKSKSNGPIPEMCRSIVSAAESGCKVLQNGVSAVEKSLADIADDFAEQNASKKKQ